MENIAIRMLLCDVDGTLLPKGHATVSNDVFHTIRQAVEKKISFIVASGRNYKDLHALFAPVADAVSFICCDGSLAIQNGQLIYHAPIPKSVILAMTHTVSLQPDESLVLYGKDCTYYIGGNNCMNNYKQIHSVDEISCDIYKIAFSNLTPFNRHAVGSFANRSGKLSKIYSDSFWIEFVAFGIHKGIAAAALQTNLDISPFETAAFGDNTNDFGMLRCARLSFASPGAISDIVKICKYQTNNVTDEILKIITER